MSVASFLSIVGGQTAMEGVNELQMHTSHLDVVILYGLEPSPWAFCPAPLTATDVLTNAVASYVDYGQNAPFRCINANRGIYFPIQRWTQPNNAVRRELQ